MLQESDAYLIVGNDLVLPLAEIGQRFVAKTCLSRGGISDLARKRGTSAAAAGARPVTLVEADEPPTSLLEDARMIAFLFVLSVLFCLAVAALVAVWAVFAIVAIRLCVAIIRSILRVFAGGRR